MAGARRAHRPAGTPTPTTTHPPRQPAKTASPTATKTTPATARATGAAWACRAPSGAASPAAARRCGWPGNTGAGWRAQERMHLLAAGWGGGTRIGECLRDFIRGTGARLVHSRTAVIVVSDGYDTAEPALLAQSLAALRARARRIVWLNPLLGQSGFTLEPRGMRAALPHLHLLAPAPTWQASNGCCRNSSRPWDDERSNPRTDARTDARTEPQRRALCPGHGGGRGRADFDPAGRAGHRSRRRHAARLDRRRLRQGRGGGRSAVRDRQRCAEAGSHQQRRGAARRRYRTACAGLCQQRPDWRAQCAVRARRYAGGRRGEVRWWMRCPT